MIIIAVPDKDVRKRLCDLLIKERIIGVNSVADILETLCRFQKSINLIVVSIGFLDHIVSNQTVQRLCQKLRIAEPPIVGIFKKDEQIIKKTLEKDHENLSLIEYREQDPEFPVRYISRLKKLYPALNADLEKAKETWHKKEEDKELMDIGRWLEEEGFLEAADKKETPEKVKMVEEMTLFIEELLTEEPAKTEEKTTETTIDYKRMYLELKQKYDELLKYVKELTDFFKDKK